MAISWNGLDGRYRRVITESVWVAIGQAARAIGMLVGIRLLTSYVTPAVYGRFSLLIGVLALGIGVFCSPYLHAVNRFYHDAIQANSVPALRREIKKLLIKATCILVAVIIASGSIVARFKQNAALVTTLLLSILLFAEIFSAYESTYLTAARRQARYASWVATEAWLKPCAAIALIWIWHPSVDAILIGYVIGLGLTLLLFYRPSTNAEHDPQTADILKETPILQQIIAFTMPLFPLALVGWVSSLGDRYLIGGILDYSAVGIYAAAYAIALQPFYFLGGIIELTIRPLYFHAVSIGARDREKVAFKSWLMFTAGISVVGLGFVLLFDDWLSCLLLGQGFHQASELMPWLAAGGGLLAISQVLEKPFYAHLKTRYVLFIQLWGAIASVILCLLLITVYGLKGAAAAAPFYYGCQCVVAIYFNRKMVHTAVENELS